MIGILILALALALALIGAGAINPGFQGFTRSGMDVGFGVSPRGNIAKVVGVVVVLFGLAFVYPLFWFVTEVFINLMTPRA